MNDLIKARRAILSKKESDLQRDYESQLEDLQRDYRQRLEDLGNVFACGLATIQDLLKTYTWGVRAFEKGFPVTDNPYVADTDLWREWRLGWMDAKERNSQ